MSARAPGVCWGLLLLCGAVRAEDEFHASIGPGIYAGPSFPGSHHVRKLLFPFIDAEYAGRLYTSAEDLIGVYAYKTVNTQLGAAITYDPTERLSRDDARLRGLPDVRETERLKFFGSRTVGALTADANLARDIAGRGEGTLGQVNLWLTVPFAPSFSISAGPGVTWGDHGYVHTLYTVTPAEAAVSVLPVFAGRAGMVDAHLNGLAEWVIHSRYRLGAQAWLGHLRGAAAASPICVRHEQTTVVGWIAYRFN